MGLNIKFIHFFLTEDVEQLSTFTKNLLKENKEALNEDVSVCDLLNIAKDIIRPGKMNVRDILQQSHAIGQFFKGEYLSEDFRKR